MNLRLLMMGLALLMTVAAHAVVAPGEVFLVDGENKVTVSALEKALSQEFKAEFRIQEFSHGAYFYFTAEPILEPLGLSDHDMRTFATEMKTGSETHLIWCEMDYTYHDHTLHLRECDAEGKDSTKLKDVSFTLDYLLKMQESEKSPIPASVPVS